MKRHVSVDSKFLSDKILFVMATCMLALMVIITGSSLASTMLWEYRLKAGYVDASPAIGDLDGDGIKDIVICSTAGRVIALDVNGRQKWMFDAGWVISCPPTITNFRDHRPKVIVLTNVGRVICLDGKSGARLWEYALPGQITWGSTAVAAADINNDGRSEIIVADKEGHLLCLDEQGSSLWLIKYKNGINTAPALADIDGDGQWEILVGTSDSPLVCFSNKGKERWRMKQGGATGSGPLVYDLNGDKQPEILLGQGDGISVVNARGKLLWHHRMKKQVHDAIAIADLDEDGKAEIVVVDLFGQVACLSSDGKLQWTGNVEQRARRSPTIADIDGDSMPEIIVGGYSGALHIFDREGNLKERVQLKGAMNASPTVVDFRGNHKLSVICPTTSNVVALTWIKSKPELKPVVAWTEYRVNSARTASVIHRETQRRTHLAEIDFGDLYVGTNYFRVTVENPEKRRLVLQLEISKNNGIPLKSTITSSDSIFSYTMPYSIVGQSAENLRFKCLVQGGRKLLLKREQVFYIIPYAKDIADLERTLSEIKSCLPNLVDDEYVRQRLTYLQHRLSQLREKVKVAATYSPLERGSLRDNLSGLRDETTRLLAMSKAAAAAESILAVYGANPWAPFGGCDEIVEGRTDAPIAKLAAYPGEIESGAFNLANFSGRPLIVRIEAQPIICLADSQRMPTREVLTFHEVLEVPTHTLDLSADALPRVGQAYTMIVPSWSVRQLWVNVDTEKLTPGHWKSVIRFKTLQVEPTEVNAELEINVWDINLPEQQPLRLCHWGYVHTSILKDQPQAAFEDQVSHGTNVFVATNAFSPKARFDEQGNLTGEIDFSAHDEYVRQHAPYGVILFCGYQGSLKGPAERFTPQWIKAYKQWLGLWIKHLQEMGIGYDNYALYPIDEPGLREGLVDDFIAYAKPIREVDPKVQIYTDPVAGASLADLKKMAPYVDIWCPNRNGYLLEKGAEKLAFIKSTGKTVWTYECEGDVKHQSPLGYYRAQSWLVWHHGLTGIGFWSYCTSRHDPWHVPLGGQDYLLIYQGDGVVTSKRWEAVRDGMEDYLMLEQLKQAVEHAAENKALASSVQMAKKLLKKEAWAIAQYCGLDKAGTLPGTAGMATLRQVEDARWQKIQEVRRQIAELLMALSPAEKDR